MEEVHFIHTKREKMAAKPTRNGNLLSSVHSSTGNGNGLSKQWSSDLQKCSVTYCQLSNHPAIQTVNLH